MMIRPPLIRTCLTTLARHPFLPAFLALLALVAGWRPAHSWTDTPTPLAGAHLVVLHPGDFMDATGRPVATADDRQWFKQMAPVTAPISCPIRVRYPGTYQLWLRVAEGTPRQPLTVELLREGQALLRNVINDGEGSPARGGAAGFTAFARQARERLGAGANGAPDDPDAVLEGGVDQNLLDELNGKPQLRWVTASRVETLTAGAACYWWRAGAVELPAGSFTLRVSGGPGRVNAGFLTGYPDLVYPYGGDIDIAPSSYIRFRIDGYAGQGLSLSGKVQKHTEPWFSDTGYFTPDGLAKREEARPFTKPGYSPWYRLQDLKECPPYGAVLSHLLLEIPDGAEGATQFASFPHGDYAVREIDWGEYGGNEISMETDFAHGIDKIRTVRDHAREHYFQALDATGGALYPLTRGPLYLWNNLALLRETTFDDTLKSQRLLGFNCAGIRDEVVENRRRYGWSSSTGIYAPPLWLPFDEAATRQKFDDFFKDQFATDREAAAGYTVFQMSDEPPEYLRGAMSSPLWRYYPPEKGGPRLDDRGGSSALYTKKNDYRNCVLEGKFIVYGGYITIRVGCREREQSKTYAEWDIGQVMNFVTLRASRNGEIGGVRLNIPNIIEFNTPVPFKVVYGGDTAALYLYGRLINRIDSLPVKTGFGFLGPNGKGFTELRIRPLTPEERREAIPVDNADPDGLGGLPDEDDEGAGPEEPAWAAPKPLDRFVKEDWTVAGGVPEAHIAFRKWAQAQGLTPQTFGRQAWDEVTMITVPALVETEGDRKLYYWSRRYSGYLTPKLFSLACEALRAACPNPAVQAFVALSGHYYFGDAYPLDVFQLAQYGGALTPGVSDWMGGGTWRWDSHQTVAYSVAPYNAGARVYGGTPRSYPMMHCVFPSAFRSYTMLANNVRLLSYYTFGPSYTLPGDFWSEVPSCYRAVQETNNRACQVDDVLSNATLRPSRVALLFSMANEYWGEDGAAAPTGAGNPANWHWRPRDSFSDKRATFLGLSHEYYQPELVTEDQAAASALAHYDVVYVLDSVVSTNTRARLKEFLEGGGLVWTCADALQWDEYGNPDDFLARTANLTRTYTREERNRRLTPAAGETGIRAQDTLPTPVDTVAWPGATVRARYGDGRPAWLEKAVGKGKLVYLAHRCGTSYSKNSIVIWHNELDAIFSDVGREPLVLPLKEARVTRELTFSSPLMMANPLSTATGTVIPIYNMTALPAKGITFSLKEAARPVSVQAFTGMTKIDLPFTYADGRVQATLPEFTTSQMVLVRTAPAPVDDRLQAMQKNTRALLASPEAHDIAAGLFYAGFFPAWGLGEQALPFLRHAQRDVRRDAAEALGRLRFGKAADALVQALAAETDTHARAEEIYALALLGDARFPALAEPLCDPLRPVLQQRVLQAVIVYLTARKAAGPLGDAQTTFGQRLAVLADDSDDPRIYTQAAPLLGLVAPQRLAARARSYLPWAAVRDAEALTGAIAAHAETFDACLADPPANHRLLLALATEQRDPRLATLLAARMDDLVQADADAFTRAAITQADPGLAKAIFNARGRPANPLGDARACLILDCTFGARLGRLTGEWAEWLKTH